MTYIVGKTWVHFMIEGVTLRGDPELVALIDKEFVDAGLHRGIEAVHREG